MLNFTATGKTLKYSASVHNRTIWLIFDICMYVYKPIPFQTPKHVSVFRILHDQTCL